MPRPKAATNGDRKVSIIRLIYLYLISAITFIVFLIGAIALVDLGLKVFVLDIEEDYYRSEPYVSCEHLVRAPVIVDEESGEKDMGQAYEDCMAKQEAIKEKKEARWISESHARDLSIGIAQVLVALPLWLFHWRRIEKDRKECKKRK